MFLLRRPSRVPLLSSTLQELTFSLEEPHDRPSVVIDPTCIRNTFSTSGIRACWCATNVILLEFQVQNLLCQVAPGFPSGYLLQAAPSDGTPDCRFEDTSVSSSTLFCV